MSYQSIFSNLFKTYADIQDFAFRKKAVKAIADKKDLEAQEKANHLKSFEVEMDFLGKGLDDLRKEMQSFYKKILEL